MKIIEKISKKQDFYHNAPATIAVLGDSVSHGCFECYELNGGIETVYDIKSAYSTKLREMLNVLFPASQINIIDSGISGDSASNGVTRIDRDILPYNPDLCIVSYQLNDSCGGKDGLNIYIESLDKIFKKLKEKDIEVIFLTENFMCKEVSPLLKTELEKGLAKGFAEIQNSGVEKMYRDAAIELCEKHNIKVCDMYGVWEKFSKNNVNFDYVLANKLNHPIRELHYYIAMKLIETMFED